MELLISGPDVYATLKSLAAESGDREVGFVCSFVDFFSCLVSN